MNKLTLLASALEYIEENLAEELKTDDIAMACFCSKSTLEKLFMCINHMSIREYIVRRRMTRGGRLLIENPKTSVLDVALSVGYGSHEAFTRTFKQVWNCKPSEFRKQARYSELYPKLCPPLQEGDDYMKARRQYDISELYDLMKARKNCYFICCDVMNLSPINEISNKAGDLVILEALKRLNEVSGEEDVVFRIGGDEFVIMTGSEEEEYAGELRRKVLDENGKGVVFEGRNIPVNLYATCTRLETGTIRYSDVFCKLHEVIKDNK